jgi:hypothetical protein
MAHDQPDKIFEEPTIDLKEGALIDAIGKARDRIVEKIISHTCCQIGTQGLTGVP